MRAISQVIAASWLLAVTAGCMFVPQEEDVSGSLSPWHGTIRRGAEVVDFVGYDPQVTDASFGAQKSAIGYVDTDDGLLHVYVSVASHDAKLPDSLGAVDLNATPKRDEISFDVSYIEKIPSGQPRAGELVYRSDDGQNNADELSGTLTIEESDFDTFLRGQLNATIRSPNDGERVLDLHVSWRGPKG